MISFFFPYREVSGVPVLFARMAERIAQMGLRVSVIDYADGYMAKALAANPDVEIQVFNPGEPFFVTPRSTLVLQSCQPYALPRELRIDPDSKLVFWTLFPFNLVPLVPVPLLRDVQAKYRFVDLIFRNSFARSAWKKTQQLVSQMEKQRALFFMDGECASRTAQSLKLKIERPNFLPVPCKDFSNNAAKSRKRAAKELHIAWLGRLCDFKVHILVYTIQKLKQLAQKKSWPMVFHVIGDGECADLIKGISRDDPHFSIKLTGTLGSDAVDDYLLANIDLMAAMGTSALEGAKLGLPTILLDASYTPIRGDYRFRWLFDAQDFCLAEIIDANNFEPQNDSLEQMLGQIGDRYGELSDKTFNYYQANHSMDVVSHAFLKKINESSLQFGDIDPWVFEHDALMKTFVFGRRALGRLAK